MEAGEKEDWRVDCGDNVERRLEAVKNGGRQLEIRRGGRRLASRMEGDSRR